MFGPVTKVSHATAAVFHLANTFYRQLEHTVRILGLHSLLERSWLTNGTLSLFCDNIPQLCTLIERFLVSADPKTDDIDRFTVLLDHQPNGTSVRGILMYAQGMKQDRFQLWAPNYDPWIPFTGEKKMPLIPIETIRKVPVAMFVGKADKLADPQDAEWTRDTIGEGIVHY